ncbi:MAG: aconitase X catalytic domain-containing protein, partial [Dongiaceae bacterium]
RAIAAGDAGEAQAMAMRLLVGMGELLGAPRLIPVVSAHIDGAVYHGDSGVYFSEKLVAGGGTVAVPTTLNVGGLDLVNHTVRQTKHGHEMALRLMRAYETMGCRPTWTCAPYQAGHRPKLGEQVAWGESNAVAFCNSVLGARTNRYGDFLDICCAILARVPDYGLHRDENRRARVLVDVTALPERLKAMDVLYPVLGYWYGQAIGSAIGVIDGLPSNMSEDRLKSFGAAAASSGAVGLFHIAGVTPEARTLDAAFGGHKPETIITLDPAVLRAIRDKLSTTTADAIDAVALGSPHFSNEEFAQLEALLGERKVAIPFFVCTGRAVVQRLEEEGRFARLRASGVTIVADTCVVVAPILPEKTGVLMTNSGKFAHYTPSNTGYGVIYGSLEDCVASAMTGRVTRDERIWS